MSSQTGKLHNTAGEAIGFALSADPSPQPARCELDRRREIARFFRKHRLRAGLSIEETARAAEIPDATTLLEYEHAVQPIPLEDIFSLTNVLNIAPDAVLTLVHELFSRKI